MAYTRKDILRMMRERILILDGATGTYLQQLGLTENDFRGTIFNDHPLPLKGCNDVLCITKPEAIRQMHQDYINAGADIIETNSFNCNRFSLADYGLEDKVYEIAKAAAEVASSCKSQKSKDKKSNERVMKRGILIGLVVLGAMMAMVSCNVTRTVTTQSQYWQKGDTSVVIQTRTIESYDATKKLSY